MKLGDRRGEVELSPVEFETHLRETRILERKLGRPVLLGHTDGGGVRLLTRVWYPKGRWSSDRIWPYSDRFCNAARLLRERGIEAPLVRAHGNVGGTLIRFAVFEEIEGTPLRLLQPRIDLRAFATYLAELHARGVYCRGLNLGSVLAMERGGFALQDVADTKLLDRPLPVRMRQRNLGILCANTVDLEFMLPGRWSDLVMAYCRAAGLTLRQSAGMLDRVRTEIERRRARRQGRDELATIGAAGPPELLGSHWYRRR